MEILLYESQSSSKVSPISSRCYILESLFLLKANIFKFLSGGIGLIFSIALHANESFTHFVNVPKTVGSILLSNG